MFAVFHPCRHRKNMETALRKAPDLLVNSDLGPSSFLPGTSCSRLLFWTSRVDFTTSLIKLTNSTRGSSVHDCCPNLSQLTDSAFTALEYWIKISSVQPLPHWTPVSALKHSLKPFSACFWCSAFIAWRDFSGKILPPRAEFECTTCRAAAQDLC